MKLQITLIIFLLLPACAPSKKESLKSSDAGVFSSKSIQASKYKQPTFIAITAGKGAFGAVGVLGMAKAGNRLVKENNIQDPANKIGVSLVNFMSKKYNMSAINNSVVAKSKSLSSLKSTYPKADVLLDIKTRGWQFAHYPTKFKYYHVTYSARLRLINLKANKVMMTNNCVYTNKPKDHTKAFSHAALVANSAQGLKNELVKAQKYCINQFKASL